MDRRRIARDYLLFGLLCLFLIAVGSWLVPWDQFGGRWRPLVFAFMFGSLVGMSEIASRYRDEPLRAMASPFGLIYAVLNGSFSIAATFIILRFSNTFPGIAADGALLAITAGFGATAVMRTRLAVIKGADGKDVSIGPDYVVNILMQAVDKNVDRHRAAVRQTIVVDHLRDIRTLGSFTTAADYLLASLNAFQNLDAAVKDSLTDVFEEYQKRTIPDDIKYLAMGFVFLTIVGERHFADVIDNAKRIQSAAGAGGAPPPPAGVVPAATPP